MPGRIHETIAGAAASQVHHAAGGHEDPTFTDERTVPEEETERPTTNNLPGGVGPGPQIVNGSTEVEVICGPLLNYRRMSKENTDNPIWHGSILLVTTAGQQRPPGLRLRIVQSSEPDGVLNGASNGATSLKAEKLYEDPKSGFWRFMIEVPFQAMESKWEYTIMDARNVSDTMIDSLSASAPRTFAIPSKTQSMRMLFHSCNGFSPGTDEDAWSGCALWNDVLRMHAEKPFHVMIGGGDQIYNDGVRIDGPLKPWTDIGNPKRRRDFQFNEELRAKCDQYYYDSYVRWYNTEPFSTANAQIPQVNIWDDHDIIDGFGSYTDNFMQCAVFRGIGGVAHKYYLLFQHHLPPPLSTFTTDAPATMHANSHVTSGRDAVQLKDSWVNTTIQSDPCYIIGKSPGPYVEEPSRSIYCQLGARIALLGIDARTERTRHQVNYEETYSQIFARVDSALSSNKQIKHLILLLGIPIAYPRLQWLENIFQSPIIGPLRFLNKRFGFAGGFFNHFDGQVDLLDDLDDHYTAHQHKKERKMLILRLQDIAQRYNVRVTILGGDVHLGALGRFYSNPALNIAPEADYRFMVNVISSAITNKPPPAAVANLLARRNKIHHLDASTDETLVNLFDRDPGHEVQGVKPKTADKNHCTMPSRNFAVLAESRSLSDPSGLRPEGVAINGHVHGNGHANAMTGVFKPDGKNPRDPIHQGEVGCGTSHPAASGLQATGLGGPDGLDVTLRVEIDPHDRSGRTIGYGISIPGLDCKGYAQQGKTW